MESNNVQQEPAPEELVQIKQEPVDAEEEQPLTDVNYEQEQEVKEEPIDIIEHQLLTNIKQEPEEKPSEQDEQIPRPEETNNDAIHVFVIKADPDATDLDILIIDWDEDNFWEDI